MSHPIVLFDGICNFCDASVNWIIARDRRGIFRFAALQSAAGERLQREYGLDPTALDTLVLVEGYRAHRRSGAALRVLRQLRLPWPLLFGLIVVPPFVRDFVYDFFARRRYRWFGRREECMLPAPEVRDRFLVD
ncbi:MAG TPA: DCC1-like thiol-disulfide oxidoreductase family protein [Dehalococcoidia bacterium]|nr:DCC1-like thiol-disulfide oxidoreductase family protein [Dehalococcoidia bacterium]